MVRLGIATAAAVLLLSTGTGTAAAASGADTFRLPSGNVYCAYEHYSFAPVDLRCEIRSGVKPLPPRPKACGDADWGGGYSMRRTGPAHVLCITDTIYDPKAKLLGYGTTWRGGGFTCISRAAGLRCTNAGGDGFFLSRQRSYSFRQAGQRSGTFRTPSGNIVCGYGDAFVECGIKSGLEPAPKAVNCRAGDFTDKRVSLTATGRAIPVTCAGDPGPFAFASKAWVLGYGESWEGGGIGCLSETKGLTCRNRNGRGFFLSRGRWRSF